MPHRRIQGAFHFLFGTLNARYRRVDTSGAVEFTYVYNGVSLAILLRGGHLTLFHEVLFRLLLNHAFPELVEASTGGVSHVLGALVLCYVLFDALSSILCISRGEDFALF